MSELKEFYAGQNILITGTTGFMGKALLEKLLRSCPEIEAIFILIRAKREKSVQERLAELFAEPVFDVLRIENPDFAKKIISLPGDIAQERLGLSATDYERVVSKVSVIFHLAATVRFNEKLDIAVDINTNSVKHIVNITKALKNRKATVYVSTAYSHCVRNSIKEETYPPPMSHGAVNELIETAIKNKYSTAAMNRLTKEVLGDWPNTYTFTKAIGESVIAEEAKELPFAIFRPSIVTNAYEESMPGWIFGLTGLHGMFYAVGMGVVRVGLVDYKSRADIVPVDYVCNALISCAWETAITERRKHEDIPVYNYTSGSENPISWGKLMTSAAIYLHIIPTNAAIYYPSPFTTNSILIFSILEFLFHIIPALMVDTVRKLLGRKPKFYKLTRKIRSASCALGYFSLRQWEFENDRVQKLWKRLTPEDKSMFPFSLRNIDWDVHCMRIIKGLRKFLWLDEAGNEKKARRRHLYLHIIHSAVRLTFLIFGLWIMWRVFYNRSISIVIGEEEGAISN